MYRGSSTATTPAADTLGACSSASPTPRATTRGLRHRHPRAPRARPSPAPRRRSSGSVRTPAARASSSNPAMVGGADTVARLDRRRTAAALGGDRTGLPFLLKVLAAAAPLSLQAHPTPEQAARGLRSRGGGRRPARRPRPQLQGPVPEARARRGAQRAVRGAQRLPARRAETLADVEALDAGSGRLGPLVAHLHAGARGHRPAGFEAADASAHAVIDAVGHLAAGRAGPDPNTATVRRSPSRTRATPASSCRC